MEQITQTVLTNDKLYSLQGVDVKEELLGKISMNLRVQNYWCTLIKEKLTGDTSKKLFNTVVIYYVRIRSKVFIRVYFDNKKAKTKKITRKAEKGLRKGLESG